jgi:hypothetical protein
MSETPITAEWLLEHGFTLEYKGVYFRAFPDTCIAGVMASTQTLHFGIRGIAENCAVLPRSSMPFTTERLSALWVGLTGEGL